MVGDSLPGLGSMGLTQRPNRAPRARVTPGIARSSIRPDRRSRLADHCRRSVEPRILWLVPLACLCAVGLSPAQVPWQISLALAAFVRLRTVLPVTFRDHELGVGAVAAACLASAPPARSQPRGHLAPPPADTLATEPAPAERPPERLSGHHRGYRPTGLKQA